MQLFVWASGSDRTQHWISVHCCLAHYCCVPSAPEVVTRCLAPVQSAELDNGGTSKQSTVMFGGKPDMSRMSMGRASIWSVKCALLPSLTLQDEPAIGSARLAAC